MCCISYDTYSLFIAHNLCKIINATPMAFGLNDISNDPIRMGWSLRLGFLLLACMSEYTKSKKKKKKKKKTFYLKRTTTNILKDFLPLEWGGPFFFFFC